MATAFTGARPSDLFGRADSMEDMGDMGDMPGMDGMDHGSHSGGGHDMGGMATPAPEDPPSAAAPSTAALSGSAHAADAIFGACGPLGPEAEALLVPWPTAVAQARFLARFHGLARPESA